MTWPHREEVMRRVGANCCASGKTAVETVTPDEEHPAQASAGPPLSGELVLAAIATVAPPAKRIPCRP